MGWTVLEFPPYGSTRLRRFALTTKESVRYKPSIYSSVTRGTRVTKLLKHLASKAIVNGKYDAIYDLLAEMNVPERSSAIFDWAIGGQIIFDFVWLRKNLDSDGEVSAVSEIHGPRITSLCNRVSHLKCDTSYDRLAQVEMARHCSRYLKSLINKRHHPTGTLSASSGVDTVASILPSLSCLPLPENHAMAELNQLTRQFLLQIA